MTKFLATAIVACIIATSPANAGEQCHEALEGMTYWRTTYLQLVDQIQARGCRVNGNNQLICD